MIQLLFFNWIQNWN